MAASTLVTTLALIAAWAVSASTVTPIQQVLTMMETMKDQGVKDKADEEVAFAAFTQFCTDTSASKQSIIDAGAAKIEKLDADIAKATSDIEALADDIAELNEDLDRWEIDKKAATDVREKERTDYQATHKDYEDTVDAVARALTVLKKMPEAISQSFVQKPLEAVAKAPALPAEDKRALVALLATVASGLADGVGLDVQNPKANAFESSSGGVTKMLEELDTRFKAEKTDLEKEEISARASYQSIMQRLTDQEEGANAEVSSKSKQKASRTKDKAEDSGELETTKTAKAEDEKYLSELKTLCSTKADAFKDRQQLRAEEIEAIEKAIEIIGSNAVKGSGEKHLPAASLTQEGISTLAQLRSSNSSPELKKVASLLAERAKMFHSSTLAMVAQKADSDPFAKVKQMIKDLIVKLLEEAAGESDHKAFCDAELATNKQTRTYKAEAVEELTAEVEKLSANSAKLTSEIADLSTEISDLDAAMTKATEERQAEKTKNAATVKDADAAVTAVGQALAVLREFYAKSAQATALLQSSGPADDAPATFDSAYTGQSSESTGVIGMLEVIESDFARLQAETEAAEGTAAADYKTFMNDSDEDRALKNTEMDHKNNKKTTMEELLVSTKSNLQRTQTELDAALNYYEKLKPDCVDSGMSYEERVKRRQEELESLQDAYKIMAGEDVPSLSQMKAEQI